MMKSKKGQGAAVGVLMGLVLAVVAFLVLGFVISITANVQEDYRTTLTAGTASSNASVDNLAGLDKISGFQPTIGLVMVAGSIIALLLGGLLAVFVARRGGFM